MCIVRPECTVPRFTKIVCPISLPRSGPPEFTIFFLVLNQMSLGNMLLHLENTLNMLGWALVATAAFFGANATAEILFAECPDTYSHFCFHGTCRLLISEWSASCICFKGYMGNRCQSMDLLQVMAGDPRSILVVVALGLILTVISSTYLGAYFIVCTGEELRVSRH
ncbi:uncharacterized protein [Engystomops pustulosus]|uniref:uncharacterized protein isoform X2 n=1 Tax=Engystomops pustulosus TaxID=76066 RepID=UPI003AFA5B42